MLYPKRFHEYSTCCQGQIWYLIEIRHFIVNFIVSRFSILHQRSSVQVGAKSAFRKMRQSLYELYCRHAARQKTNGLSQVYYPTMPTLAAGEGGQTPWLIHVYDIFLQAAVCSYQHYSASYLATYYRD